MLHQIVYVLTGSSQRSVVSTTDRQHHIAASLTQSFDFAVLSVILHTVSGTPCRQTGVRIFTHHKRQREVVDVMILSQRSQIRDRIQRKVNIRCINVFRPRFLRRTYALFGSGPVNKNTPRVAVRRRNFLHFTLRNVVHTVKANQRIAGIKRFWIKLRRIIQLFVAIALSLT